MQSYNNPLALLTTDPVELSVLTLKTRLMLSVSDMIKERNLTQQEAADFLGVTQPRISGIMGGNSSGISIEALLRMLGKFGLPAPDAVLENIGVGDVSEWLERKGYTVAPE